MARNPYYHGPTSDHFDGTRFFNPGAVDTDHPWTDIVRWRITAKRATWPDHVPVTPAAPEPRVAGCRATMVGHASVLIQAGGLNILTDPVWSERASPFSFAGPKRVTAPGIHFDDLPPIDLVLVSHGHYDHLDTATLARLTARDRPLIVTPLGNDAVIRAKVPDARIAPRDWGERAEVAGAAVTIVRANHWSARGVRDRRMTLWCGFVLEVGERRIYFAGDTGYGDGAIFRDIGERHGPFDLALIPIGAYDPRWFMAPQHAEPEEAVRMVADVRAACAMAIHWGCFQLTDEPRDEPPQRLARALAAAGEAADRFVAPAPGECVEV